MSSPGSQQSEHEKPAWHYTIGQAISGSIIRWRSTLPNVDELIAFPIRLRIGDAEKARDIYAGRFEFYGQLPGDNALSPFDAIPPSPAWLGELHGFTWLNHLAMADTPLSKTNARMLIRDWITTFGRERKGVAWLPEITAIRIISWLTNSPAFIGENDREFYRNFLSSLADQTAWLEHAARSLPEDMPLLNARIAFAFASLCLGGQNLSSRQKHQRLAAEALGQEIDRQFLADGMHVSRNPDNCLKAMLYLLPLYQTYIHLAVQPPPGLVNIFDRVLPMLRFFRHRDGTLGQFNGGGVLSKVLLETVLQAGRGAGQPPDNASPSGYQRFQNGGTTILVDAGYPRSQALSRNAHAGCLSFEMSSKSSRFIINCGTSATLDSRLRIYARSTAAHSTATLNDTSSCRIQQSTGADNASVAEPLSGIEIVTSKRKKNIDGEWITASHDGYVRQFGLVHQRTLYLANGGATINGSDRFSGQNQIERTGASSVVIRFHIHPDIDARIINNGISVLLTARDGEAWKFTCVDAGMHLEDSIDFAGAMKKTCQIVLSASVVQAIEIRWVFEQCQPAGHGKSQKEQADSNHSDQELLDVLARNIDK